MEVQEHFYADDPSQGPADARTTIPGAEYFFLGNGLIQAAVQVCGSGAATPVGLLVMDPERLGPKRRALTFDPAGGLGPTGIELVEGRTALRPGPSAVKARWVPRVGFPMVEVTWRSGPYRVVERLLCGLPWAKASLRLRGGRLDILVRTARPGEEPGYWAGRSYRRYRKSGIDLPLPADGETLRLEAVLPRRAALRQNSKGRKYGPKVSKS
jgi:hypothetical protein